VHSSGRRASWEAPVKELARALLPPVLWRALSGTRRRLAPPSPWSFGGVFSRFDEVTDQQPWTGTAYVESCRAQLRDCQAGSNHPAAAVSHAVLSLLVNTLPRDRTPRVLDWAGGTGLRYWTSRPALNRRVHWHVVDSPVLAPLSGEIMGQSDELTFSAEMPALDQAFDLVHVHSSLQYVEDQAPLLKTFAAYRPAYLVFARFMGLADASYVTRQTIHGRTTPCKVASVHDVVATLASVGYEPALVLRDGLDLNRLTDATVPAHLQAGLEWLLVFREAR
jgi:putative methyltransferase (TIGR04325 family)